MLLSLPSFIEHSSSFTFCLYIWLLYFGYHLILEGSAFYHFSLYIFMSMFHCALIFLVVSLGNNIWWGFRLWFQVQILRNSLGILLWIRFRLRPVFFLPLPLMGVELAASFWWLEMLMVAPRVQDFIQVFHNVIMRMSGDFDYMILYMFLFDGLVLISLYLILYSFVSSRYSINIPAWS